MRTRFQQRRGRHTIRRFIIAVAVPALWLAVVAPAAGAASAPSAPTSPSAVAGGSVSITASWGPPATDNGSPVTGYTAFLGTPGDPFPLAGPVSLSATTMTTTFSNLTIGDRYFVVIDATNGFGAGPKAKTNTVTAVTGVPGTPSSIRVSPRNASVMVTWTAPNDGGSPITGYVLTPYIASVAQPAKTVGASVLSTTLTGLTNGTTYTVGVAAKNAKGTGPAGMSSAVTPGVPLAPPTPSAVPGNTSATVSWTAAVDNGSAVTAYTVTPYLKGVAQSPLPAASTDRSLLVSSLTNGSTYTFTVTATNTNGSGAPSAQSNAVAVGAPTAPTSVSATAGPTSVNAAWSPPATDNGSPVTGYTAFLGVPGDPFPLDNVSLAASTTTTTFSNLSPGAGYFVVIDATNANGTGPNAKTNTVTALTGVPGTPSSIRVSPGNGSVTVTWSAPGDGGSQITSYVITPYIGSVAQPAQTSTVTITTLTGLTNGTTYTVGVAAKNANGTGPVGMSSAVTPGVPLAPPAPSAVSGNTSATVSWTAPEDNGSAITGYTVTPYLNGVAQSPLPAASTDRSLLVSGLTNGSSFTFTVAATNSNGTGAPSAQSNAVSIGSPTAPTSPSAVAGPGSITASWGPPATDNGSPVTGYIAFLGTPGDPFPVVDPVSLSATTTSTTFSNLTSGTRYFVVIEATNANGTGPKAQTNGITAG